MSNKGSPPKTPSLESPVQAATPEVLDSSQFPQTSSETAGPMLETKSLPASDGIMSNKAGSNSWDQYLSLSALDDIDPDNVRNSTAFKLGALAGLLPALSVMSLTQFLTPEQIAPSQGGAGDFSLWSGLLVLLSSAMVGGSVAFFWAENRLRTIFTYGIAGPTVVLSMFLSGISNVAANKRVENVQEATEQKIAAETKKAQDLANEQAQTAVQQVQSATAKMSAPSPAPVGATAPETNPDIAAP